MSTPPSSRRRAARGLAAVIVLLSLCGPLVTGHRIARADDQAVDADPAVVEARRALEEAGRNLAELTSALDAAAGAYEHANAHALRLQEELAEADSHVVAARRVVARTEDDFNNRVVGSYKRPAATAELAQAVLAAGDPGTAMHRVALIEQVTVRGAQRLDDVRTAERRTTEAVQQHHVVQVGSAGAAADARRTAEALSTLVQGARTQVTVSQQQVASAEDAVRERIAEEARRAAAAEAAARAAREAAARASAAAGVAYTTPSRTPQASSIAGPGGAYCPIAGPNGFIDSWGFPRSGGRSHEGTDMFAAYGTPLVAVTDGVVRRVWNNRLGGLSVDLITVHGDRFYYAHLADTSVTAGQQLQAGEALGSVGDSGNARGTPPHLHWQFHPGDGRPVNPYPLAVALCR